jgi:uncharacterized protein (DUF433 family)
MGMAAELIERITINPEVCSGDPTIRGMRLRVSNILEALAEGASRLELLESFPDLEDQDISAALAYAARLTMKSAA